MASNVTSTGERAEQLRIEIRRVQQGKRVLRGQIEKMKAELEADPEAAAPVMPDSASGEPRYPDPRLTATMELLHAALGASAHDRAMGRCIELLAQIGRQMAGGGAGEDAEEGGMEWEGEQ